MPLVWAIHRLGGIQTPANAQYSASELAYQLKNSGAQCLFTCLPVLNTALEAAEKAGIPRHRIYLMELPAAATSGMTESKFTTVAQLVEEGKAQPPLEALKWSKGEGKRRVAFVCYSSGTSGLPASLLQSLGIRDIH